MGDGGTGGSGMNHRYKVVASDERLYVGGRRVAVMVDHNAGVLTIDPAAQAVHVAAAAFSAGRHSSIHRPIPLIRPRWVEA